MAELRNRGVSVLPYPEAVLAVVRQAGQKVLDAMAREDANFAGVLDSYNKYRGSRPTLASSFGAAVVCCSVCFSHRPRPISGMSASLSTSANWRQSGWRQGKALGRLHAILTSVTTRSSGCDDKG